MPPGAPRIPFDCLCTGTAGLFYTNHEKLCFSNPNMRSPFFFLFNLKYALMMSLIYFKCELCLVSHIWGTWVRCMTQCKHRRWLASILTRDMFDACLESWTRFWECWGSFCWGPRLVQQRGNIGFSSFIHTESEIRSFADGIENRRKSSKIVKICPPVSCSESLLSQKPGYVGTTRVGLQDFLTSWIEWYARFFFIFNSACMIPGVQKSREILSDALRSSEIHSLGS